MLHLSEHLRQRLPVGREFEAVFGLQGEIFRRQKNRQTIRAQIGDRFFFVKTHGPTSWREILKNALRGRWPVLTAETEWDAIRRLERLGVPTTHAAGFGLRGRFPHRLESFIITEELGDFIHLSEVPPLLENLNAQQRFRLRRRLIEATARIARTLHSHGLNHRDFYLGHFMLPRSAISAQSTDFNLFLIDLHRMQIRARTPRRWAIKDISGLVFSALDADLTSRDYLRFLSTYWGRPWREMWRSTRGWRNIVLRRALSLYRSEHGRSPRLPASRASCA